MQSCAKALPKDRARIKTKSSTRGHSSGAISTQGTFSMPLEKSSRAVLTDSTSLRGRGSALRDIALTCFPIVPSCFVVMLFHRHFV
jgi:hypothetical protein